MSRPLHFTALPQDSSASVAGKYGIGFKSGSSRLCRYATVVTRQSSGEDSHLYFVSLLNGNCKDDEGNLITPTMAVDADTFKMPVGEDAAVWERNKALIEEHTHVSPLRWVNDFKRDTGTSIYLQSLLMEASDRTLSSAADAEWVILNNSQADIRHARGKQFRRVRDCMPLADNVAIDWSLRSYMETMYLRPTQVEFTLMGKRVDTKYLLQGGLGFKLQSTLPLRHFHPSTSSTPGAPCASKLHMGYSTELHRSSLTGVHIYWNNILIESYLNVSYDPLSDADHGYLGIVELDDSWGLSPLNHKQGFPKSAAKYAQLKDEVTSLWRSHIADKKRAEQEEANHDRDITTALAELHNLPPPSKKARREAAAVVWRLFPEWQVRQWADNYNDGDLITAANDSSLSVVIDLLVELETQLKKDPPTAVEMREFILQNSGGQLIFCERCKLQRRAPDALIKHFAGRTWECADSRELNLVCGQKRAQDELEEGETEISETVEGRVIGSADAAQVTYAQQQQCHGNRQSLLAVESSQFTFDAEHRLGSGKNSTVCLGMYYGVAVAVKLLNGTDIQATPSAQLIRSFNREVHVLSQLQHPLLIRMLFYNSERLAIGFEYYQEYVPLLSVFSLESGAGAVAPSAPSSSSASSSLSASYSSPLLPLLSSNPTLEDTLCVLLDVAKGVWFMHSRHFLHRDLSPFNILLHPTMWSVKILDFGESTMLRKEERSAAIRLTGQPDIGTAIYKAPERWRQDEITPASDVFSFGIMAWELITRQQAWQQHDNNSNKHKQHNKITDTPLTYEQIRNAILEGIRPRFDQVTSRHVPEVLQKLLGECWHAEVKERPTMETVVERLRSIQHSLLHGLEAFKRRHHTTVVYRALNQIDVDRLKRGEAITARQPDSTSSLFDHVRNGCKPKTAARSPFISTSRSFSWVIHYACLQMCKEQLSSKEGAKCTFTSTAQQSRRRIIVCIDLSRLQPPDWKEVYDISLPRFAAAHGLETLAHYFAVDAQEVLLRLPLAAHVITGWYEVGADYIPSAADGDDSASDMSKLPPMTKANGELHRYSPVWNKLFARKFESTMAAVKTLLTIPPLDCSGVTAGVAASRPVPKSTAAATHSSPSHNGSAVSTSSTSSRGSGSVTQRSGSGSAAVSSRSGPVASVPAAVPTANNTKHTTLVLASAVSANKRSAAVAAVHASDTDDTSSAAPKRARLKKLPASP